MGVARYVLVVLGGGGVKQKKFKKLKHFPAIPDNHFDITTPMVVVEEMDRIEEFLQWVSYIFADGSLYEGTVWDDLAHGNGVYVSDEGLMRCTSEYGRCKQCKHQLPSWLLL
ncbi:hypothetical protein MRB53_005734 [Persea americana]|uniref:Uncharacterized protein n=1 Tax=Persea americana TaxID=3435 RepID=A0ACC2MF25_PERAE|nr:hypothetical protein MRB53_005734 [Persea americana]